MPYENRVTRQWQRPPEGLGLTWQVAPRELRVSGELKALWTATEPSQDYDDALASQEGRHLRTVGYSYDRLSGLPCFWESAHLDRQAAQVLVNTARNGLQAYREKLARQRADAAEREAFEAANRERQAAEDLDLATRAIAAAKESLERHEWAWALADDVTRARRLILIPPAQLERRLAWALEMYVERAQANVDRAMAAMTAIYEPEAERAAIEDVQIAALEGCRLLSARDSDRASINNKMGWGRTTTVKGHVLSSHERFDTILASHALRALRTHRRQLPPDLDRRLFGLSAEAWIAASADAA
ncbi:hypothetical protein GOFOIKOB_0019 [Methylobacterium tardum]|uniref:Uncharacterized protein n=2 Tax=Methylobacterium tardum TaxID=374432 RepID=A0AA37TNP6_9HYPH|nr:hypothetical protein [Methylobacterium tardum]GJE47000.1 hypothetical protein GOFOIKOB_0019 [Methylobacterium tardum]GLS71628.1 hypothetical protein GCM10007890_36410 [Methylobacterium tardum]